MRIWSWQHVSVNISSVAELSPVYCCLVVKFDLHPFLYPFLNLIFSSGPICKYLRETVSRNFTFFKIVQSYFSDISNSYFSSGFGNRHKRIERKASALLKTGQDPVFSEIFSTNFIWIKVRFAWHMKHLLLLLNITTLQWVYLQRCIAPW